MNPKTAYLCKSCHQFFRTQGAFIAHACLQEPRKLSEKAQEARVQKEIRDVLGGIRHTEQFEE